MSANGMEEFDIGGMNPAVIADSERLVLNIEGFEGPLDVLLVLARTQKVDLAQISVLELAEQFLVFVTAARRLRLELAADYLVMAAWLAYLKSRLLLPDDPDDDEPSAEEMAMRLQLQLQRLNAMREAAVRLMSRDRLGRDVFARGMPEHVQVSRDTAYDVTLYELLKTYGNQQIRHSTENLHIGRRPIYSLEEALHRLEGLVGEAINWTRLQEFLPSSGAATGSGESYRKSEFASMFAAGLELARTGQIEIRQLETFGPIYLKCRKKKKEKKRSGR